MEHGSGIYLLSAIGGYWVLERAQTHSKGALKRVGQFVGWMVIVFSFLGLLWSMQCLAEYRRSGGMGKLCPFKVAPTPAQP